MSAVTLPDMARLTALWDSGVPSADNLEHATHLALALWTTSLDGVDARELDAWNQRITAATHSDAARDIARIIDDEVSWALGNHPENVTIVDDDMPRTLTVGELIYRLTLFLAMCMCWPADLGQCPLLGPFQRFGRDYDELVARLSSGTARQPRLRSYPSLPIPRPHRVELVNAPTGLTLRH
ncbi:hypothetical protein ACWEKT_20685 [Nocardia takedensis]